MVNTKSSRLGFPVSMPKRGEGMKLLMNADGSVTTVPMRRDELALYATDRMAMDAAIGGPRGGPDYALYNATDDDPDDVDNNPAAPDLEENIRALLEGKLDDADISTLIALIQPDDNSAPMPATDRRLPRPPGMARDSRRITAAAAALMRKRVAESAVSRAAASQQQFDKLVKRFPALRTARVV